MTQKALRMALEALEWCHGGEPIGTEEAITAIKEALAQTQEPVTWGVDWGKAGDISCVSIIKRLPNGGIEVVAVEYAPYSYTTTPQRTWVGLTRIELIKCGVLPYGMSYELYQAIEAKLKEKNFD